MGRGELGSGEEPSPPSARVAAGDWLARSAADRSPPPNGAAPLVDAGPDIVRHALRSSGPVGVDALERRVNRALERHHTGGGCTPGTKGTLAPPRVRFTVLDHLPVEEREPRLLAVLRADAIGSIGGGRVRDMRVTLFVLDRLDHIAVVDLPRPRIAAVGRAAAHGALAPDVAAAFDAIVDALHSAGCWTPWRVPHEGHGLRAPTGRRRDVRPKHLLPHAS